MFCVKKGYNVINDIIIFGCCVNFPGTAGEFDMHYWCLRANVPGRRKEFDVWVRISPVQGKLFVTQRSPYSVNN